MSTFKKSAFTAIFLLVFCGGYFAYWLKSPYAFPLQKQIATEFVRLVAQGEYEKAYEMTSKNIYTGKTLEEFKAKAIFEMRGANYMFAYTFPPQSNGNRLRQYLKSAEVEIPEVHVEFTGNSLLGIRLQRNSNNEWKISYFASHAG